MKLYSMSGMQMGQGFAAESALLVNMDNTLVQKLAAGTENDALIAKQIYMLALISQRRLDEKEMKEFLSGGYDVLSKLV